MAEAPNEANPEKPGAVYASGQTQGVSRSVFCFTTSAIRSALTGGESASLHLQSIQDSSLNINSDTDLVDGLREVPGREALRLRAEVASLASQLKQVRAALNKRTLKISYYGIAV